MQPLVDSCLIGTPFELALCVGNVETYFTHAIHVRESVPPIIILRAKITVPVIVKVRLKISLAFVGHIGNYLWISVHVFPIEILAYVALCHD